MSSPVAEPVLPAARQLQKFQHAYSAGDLIFQAGDRGSSMFAVIEGAVRLEDCKRDPALLLARCHPGDLFGEMALVDGGIRSACALADETPTRLVEIDKARFVYLVGQQPVFALTIIRELCWRIRSARGFEEATNAKPGGWPRCASTA